MRHLTHVLVVVCAGAVLSPSASAYYHFVHYLTRTGPFTPIPEKYDLASLPDKTLRYYVSADGPTGLAPGDSAVSVYSQIRLAASIWDAVPTSELRLAFGGIATPGRPANGPGIDVVFSDELPPGIVARGGVTTLGEGGASPSYRPILRSIVMLRKDLVDRPSRSESFFLTLVHEFGHALGLQHSLTSSVMSTSITRGTTKANPITADDVAGLSLLYPTASFAETRGAISGRVTIGGQGVALASVVAIPPIGSPVSALTNPDGTFRIEGVPPGQYFVYAHPLPPALDGEDTPANVVLPKGPDNQPIAIGPSFETVFFPGTRDAQFPLTVTAGATVENVNFLVRLGDAAISSVSTYSFFDGQVLNKPAVLNRNLGQGEVIASGAGLLRTPTTLMPGLAISTLSGSAGVVPGTLLPYRGGPYFLQFILGFTPFTIEGSHHLVFSTPGGIYVLPSGFLVTSRQPPMVSSIAPAAESGDPRLLAISGSGLNENTRILFDGQEAAVRSFDEATQRLVVLPPPALANHDASVVALGRDGQSSLLAQTVIPTHRYGGTPAAIVGVQPATLVAASEATIEVSTTGLDLIQGLAQIGFGTDDIVVRQVWAAGPNRLLANISVNGNATTGPVTLTLTNGLQMLTAPGAVTIQPANPKQISIVGNALNPATASAFLQPGGPAMLFVLNLPAGSTASSLNLTVNGQPVPVTSLNAEQLTFTIPPGTAPGPAIVRLRSGSDSASVVIQIDPPPPVVLALRQNGAAIDAAHPAVPGDHITVLVSGLVADPYRAVVPPSSVTVTVGEIVLPAERIVSSGQAGVQEVIITLTGVVPGSHELTVAQGNRVSNSGILIVR